MKKKVVIHPGFPKCGSATIQYFLRENRDKLYADGIYLPPYKINKKNGYRFIKNNSYLAFAVRKHPGKKDNTPEITDGSDKHLKLSADHRLWIDLLDRFSESNCETLVISCELFGLEPSGYDFSAVNHLFEQFDVCYPVFIRRLDRWIESRYCQAIRGSSRLRCSFNEFVPYREYLKHGYYERLDHIENCYPRGTIKVFSIDDLNQNQTIIDIFLEFSGLENLQTKNYNLSENKNISFPKEFYELLRLLNGIEIKDDLFESVKKSLQKYYLIQKGRQTGKAPLLIDPGSRRKIIDFYISECKKINDKYSMNINLDIENTDSLQVPDNRDITLQEAQKILAECSMLVDKNRDEIEVVKNRLHAIS